MKHPKCFGSSKIPAHMIMSSWSSSHRKRGFDPESSGLFAITPTGCCPSRAEGFRPPSRRRICRVCRPRSQHPLRLPSYWPAWVTRSSTSSTNGSFARFLFRRPRLHCRAIRRGWLSCLVVPWMVVGSIGVIHAVFSPAVRMIRRYPIAWTVSRQDAASRPTEKNSGRNGGRMSGRLSILLRGSPSDDPRCLFRIAVCRLER